ncbi:MAG: asparagine synthase C-terminal domain-containing protein [Candidatus Nanoarchaeia archaeon]
MELFIENGNLAPRELWTERISKIKAETTPSTKEELKEAIHKAIKDRIPNEPFGVFLSGGVDSSFIALTLKQLGADFTCYTVGIENSKDLDYARRLAKELNLKQKEKTLSLDEVETIIEQIAPWYLTDERLKDENLAVLFGVAAVEVAAINLAKEDGISTLFGGLGSEEIFAGYQRHDKADNINEECWRGLIQMWQRDLIRDCMICKKLNIDAKTPLLDKEVIKKAMGIPEEMKIQGEKKKVVLREIAEEAGLPKEWAWRKKLGAQYGSKFDVAIKKLAKRKGMQYRRDYLSTVSP